MAQNTSMQILLAKVSNSAKPNFNQGGEIQPLLPLHISPYSRKKKLAIRSNNIVSHHSLYLKHPHMSLLYPFFKIF